MNQITFCVLRATDKEYFDMVSEVARNLQMSLDSVNFGGKDFQRQEFSADNFQSLLNLNAASYNNISFAFGEKGSIAIARLEEAQTLFYDKVSVSPGQERDYARFGIFLGSIRKAFENRTTSNLNLALGAELRTQFTTHEHVLLQLQKLSADLIRDSEAARLKREGEFDARVSLHDTEHTKRQAELEAIYAERHTQLLKEQALLAEHQKTLDLQEAKIKRRQHHTEIRNKIDEQLVSGYKLSSQTRSKRYFVDAFTIAVLIVFAGLIISGAIEFHSLAGTLSGDSWTSGQMVALGFLIVKSILASAVFLGTAIFYWRWLSHYYQRLANEEVRLQRLRLDLDRANWFIELVFQWQDEIKSPIPDDMMESLTRGLFVSPSDERPPDHPADFLNAALTKLSVTAQGATLQIDNRKKGILTRETKEKV